VFEVIASVDDDRQIFGGQDLREPVDEFCPAHAAG